jgi:hypothetical protein
MGLVLPARTLQVGQLVGALLLLLLLLTTAARMWHRALIGEHCCLPASSHPARLQGLARDGSQPVWVSRDGVAASLKQRQAGNPSS